VSARVGRGGARAGLRAGAALLLALLAGGPLAAQSLRHDSSLPIEITADRLEVLQQQQLATFSGNVDAVQGDLVLSADQLRVYYDQADAPAGAGAGGGRSIRRIEAVGNVFVTSPRETAAGEFGTYEVATSLITLEGQVVLTQDDNVIRGQRLEVDLASGRSQVFAAVPSAQGGGPGERVRAIFTPQGERPAPAGGPAPDAGADAPAEPAPSQ
jgi:lipopolysaccharide export system protein LptA